MTHIDLTDFIHQFQTRVYVNPVLEISRPSQNYFVVEDFGLVIVR